MGGCGVYRVGGYRVGGCGGYRVDMSDGWV